MKLSPVGLGLLGVICYLSYHAIAGNQGLSQWSRFQDDIKSLERQKQDLLDQRDKLSQQVSRLSLETLDMDYVEELARQRFHFVYSDEVMLEPPELAPQLSENEDLFALSN